MKGNSNRLNLIGLSLLGVFGIVGLINLTDGIQINPPSAESGHVVRLFSLSLWENTTTPNPDSVSMTVNTGENFLEMQGGLVVGSGNTVKDAADTAVIGGGRKNTINAKNAGILGGFGNTVEGKNSLIGGGAGNNVNAENVVIGGGSGNNVNAKNALIIGGEKNRVGGENAVILGGTNNNAKGKNSLVGGYGAEGSSGSFAWSAKSKENTARIDVSSGMLIGTVNPKNGVRLVVSGAVSLAKFKSKEDLGTTGEIKVVSGCIFAYDGGSWQVMGKSSIARCGGTGQMCRFGESVLSQGENAKVYTNFYNTNCDKISVSVVCSGGNLVDIKTNQTGTYYPYCYDISD